MTSPSAIGKLIQFLPAPLLDFAFRHRYSRAFSWLRPVMERRLEGAADGFPMTRGPLAGYRLAFDAADSKVIWMGLHEPQIQSLVVTHLRPGQTAFDIGAHIGYFVLLMAKVVGTAGKVVGFEPDSRNFELLKRNIEINELQEVASASSVALGHSEGLGKVERGLQSGFTKITAGGEGSVRISTLDKEIYQAGLPVPDLILIDTEGAEASILKGARRLLEESSPIMIIEHHDLGTGSEKEALAALLVGHGYEISEPSSSHLLCKPSGH